MWPLVLDHLDIMHCFRASEEGRKCRMEEMVRLQVEGLETHVGFDRLKGYGKH